jgi:hypothetical protein
MQPVDPWLYVAIALLAIFLVLAALDLVLFISPDALNHLTLF